MYTVVNYVIAFWTVVVMNCIQPSNWKYCYRVDEWLIPQVKEGIEIYLDPSLVYKNEREYLNTIKSK